MTKTTCTVRMDVGQSGADESWLSKQDQTCHDVIGWSGKVKRELWELDNPHQTCLWLSHNKCLAITTSPLVSLTPTTICWLRSSLNLMCLPLVCLCMFMAWSRLVILQGIHWRTYWWIATSRSKEWGLLHLPRCMFGTRTTHPLSPSLVGGRTGLLMV